MRECDWCKNAAVYRAQGIDLGVAFVCETCLDRALEISLITPKDLIQTLNRVAPCST